MYKCGLYLGRFQPFHNGHKSVIDEMIKNCEIIIIAVGSSNKSGSIKNPFSFETRVKLIRECYERADVVIIPIPDRAEYGSNESWGDYVLNICKEYGFEPDVIYEGYEEERKSWWKNFNGKIITIPRILEPISATLIREALKDKNRWFYVHNMPLKLCPYFNELRKELIKIYDEA